MSDTNNPAAEPFKITKRSVDAPFPPGMVTFRWDCDLKGFGLKITATGKKTYIYQYRTGPSGIDHEARHDWRAWKPLDAGHCTRRNSAPFRACPSRYGPAKGRTAEAQRGGDTRLSGLCGAFH